MKKITFETKDRARIYGLHGSVADSRAPAAVLLHMMPAVKESWSDFQGKFALAGFQSLAIDLRGHGESVLKNGKVADYKSFSDEEHQESILDVEGAVDYLINKGVVMEKISIIGASIGANLALQYQARHKEIKASVLLSAGLNYRGVETELPARQIAENQAVFLAGAREDACSSGQFCADMARTFFDLLPARDKKLAIFDGAEHGMDMFVAHPQFMDDIIEWLRKIYF